MFGFGNKKNSASTEAAESEQTKTGVFERLKTQLTKTRVGLAGGLANVFFGKKQIDDALFEELETILLTADIGIQATEKLIENLTAKLKRNALKDPESLKTALHDLLCEMLNTLKNNLSYQNKRITHLL